MTPDGISTEDWARVHELAVEIVNCSAARDEAGEARARAALLVLLSKLDEKYGPRPSLLATRADYVESADARKRLLLAAYSQAERIGDVENQELTAHSLAELYIEDVHDRDEGAKWLGIWRTAVGPDPDQSDLEELGRLEAMLLSSGAPVKPESTADIPDG